VRWRTDWIDGFGFYYEMYRSNMAVKKLLPRSPRRDKGRANVQSAVFPEVERQRLTASCEEVVLSFGDRLWAQGDRMHHIYFPTQGSISLLVDTAQCPSLEVGLVGTEGAAGVTMALEVGIAPVRALVQGPGTALRIEAGQFSRELERNPALRSVVKRYLYVLMSQLGQMTACARFHLVEARLARWLLMTQDRAHSDDFYLTQEFLASMLGVRRVGVTQAAGFLQERRLIRYSRVRVAILDGRRLEGLAYACDATAKETYARVMRRRANVAGGAN